MAQQRQRDGKTPEQIARRADQRAELGKWGRMHLVYLEINEPAIVDRMEQEGALWPYLTDFDKRVTDKYLDLFEAIRAEEGIFEDKFPDWHSFYLRFNAVVAKVNEIIQQEYVNVIPVEASKRIGISPWLDEEYLDVEDQLPF